MIHSKHYLDKQESHQSAWKKIFERGKKSWFCLLWDKMLALCSYWEQTRSDTADSHHLLILPIMFPQAESPQCSGLLLLYSSPLWNYRRALSLCSMKQKLYLKSKLVEKEQILLKPENHVWTRQTTSLISLCFLPSSFISAPCIYV